MLKHTNQISPTITNLELNYHFYIPTQSRVNKLTEIKLSGLIIN